VVGEEAAEVTEAMEISLAIVAALNETMHPPWVEEMT